MERHNKPEVEVGYVLDVAGEPWMLIQPLYQPIEGSNAHSANDLKKRERAGVDRAVGQLYSVEYQDQAGGRD